MEKDVKLFIGTCIDHHEVVVDSFSLTQGEMKFLRKELKPYKKLKYEPYEPYTFLEVQYPGRDYARHIYDVGIVPDETKVIINQKLLEYEQLNQ